MRQTAQLPSASVVPIPSGLCRLYRVPAASRSFPTLSLRSLYRRLGPYPATLGRCFSPFLPARLRPRLRVNRLGSRNNPATQFYAGGLFRGCNHSLMFRLRYSLGPQSAPTFRVHALPPLGRIHRAVFAPFPVANSGIATCLNRTTDTIELVDAFAPTHLLDRSLVGCS
jgi:hypothetical protein